MWLLQDFIMDEGNALNSRHLDGVNYTVKTTL